MYPCLGMSLIIQNNMYKKYISPITVFIRLTALGAY